MKRLIQISNILLTFMVFSFLVITIANAQGSILTETKENNYRKNISTVSAEALLPSTSLEASIALALKIILSTLGTIFIVMMFVAGNQWMQAAGNEEKIKKAKARIQSLIIGLVIIILAYALANGFSSLLVKTMSLLK